MKRALLLLLLLLPPLAAGAADRACHRIALLGDPHLPGRPLAVKEAVLQRINDWEGIDRVVALGDLCETTGSEAEYAAVKRFFAPLRHPLRPIPGNHDYLYADGRDDRGRRVKAPPDLRRRKLARFAETFGLASLFASERLGRYRLLYLATDALEGDHLARLSETQLAWLAEELARHRQEATLAFFHAPLAGTLKPYNRHANTPGFVAQPADRLDALIRENPQLFLWAAGHMHVPATSESYSDPVNRYRGQVTVIHNADLQRRRPWTNLLELHPDRVVVRTYDHAEEAWRPDLQRTLPPP